MGRRRFGWIWFFFSIISYFGRIIVPLESVRFYLYPFKSSPQKFQELSFDKKSIYSSNFLPNLKTVIIIHGFWPRLTRYTPLEIKNAYLAQNTTQQNTIYMDWSSWSTPSTGTLLSSYPIIVFRHIPLVSKKLAHFLTQLVNLGLIKSQQIHLIGYSLGAHVAGLTGQLVQQRGFKIGRITGLDPALPLFGNVLGNHRLGRLDATFVVVIHTAMGRMGFMKSTLEGDGHVDFYPNGGRSPQPGCLQIDLKVPILCSHLFSVQLFILSIQQNMPACKCEPMVDLLMTVVCLGGCRANALLGERCEESTVNGQYYLPTGKVMTEVAVF